MKDDEVGSSTAPLSSRGSLDEALALRATDDGNLNGESGIEDGTTPTLAEKRGAEQEEEEEVVKPPKSSPRYVHV